MLVIVTCKHSLMIFLNLNNIRGINEKHEAQDDWLPIYVWGRREEVVGHIDLLQQITVVNNYWHIEDSSKFIKEATIRLSLILNQPPFWYLLKTFEIFAINKSNSKLYFMHNYHSAYAWFYNNWTITMIV